MVLLATTTVSVRRDERFNLRLDDLFDFRDRTVDSLQLNQQLVVLLRRQVRDPLASCQPPELPAQHQKALSFSFGCRFLGLFSSHLSTPLRFVDGRQSDR